ncbi:hypothetical protein BDV06DRAFT_219231 [Aspergillus oleicola]
MNLKATPLLLCATLSLLFASPVDTSPTPDEISISTSSLQARSDHDLKAEDADCKDDFPQFYKIEDEMRDMFEEAAAFRAQSQTVCDKLIPKFYNGKNNKKKEVSYTYLAKDADIYVSSQRVLWGKNLRVVYKVSLTDEGAKSVHSKEGLSQKDFKAFCVDALEKYGTKDKGCTKDPQEFSNGVVKKRTMTTGVLAGSMKWKDGNEEIATLSVKFEKPQKQVT